MEEVVFKTQEELESCLGEWKQRLQMESWRISIKVAREHEFGVSGRAAEIDWVLPNKVAAIKVLDPIDFVDCLVPQDMERDIVHELLHPTFGIVCDFDGNELAQSLYEQAIETTAAALVATKRAGTINAHTACGCCCVKPWKPVTGDK